MSLFECSQIHTKFTPNLICDISNIGADRYRWGLGCTAYAPLESRKSPKNYTICKINGSFLLCVPILLYISHLILCILLKWHFRGKLTYIGTDAVYRENNVRFCSANLKRVFPIKIRVKFDETYKVRIGQIK